MILRGLGAALLALISAGSALAQGKVVNVYNWSDYIDKAVISGFERETGIKVRYDTYDSNDLLQTKLLAGKTGYDVVVPTSTFLANQIAAGALRKLDKAKLRNFKNLDPELMARLAKVDPGNQYAVIYLWGTTGIGLNREKVRARMQNPPSASLPGGFRWPRCGDLSAAAAPSCWKTRAGWRLTAPPPSSTRPWPRTRRSTASPPASAASPGSASTARRSRRSSATSS